MVKIKTHLLDRLDPPADPPRSFRLQTGNELTAVMNEAGNLDCLLSLVPYDQNHWLAWVVGNGVLFRIIPDSIAYRILSSAYSQAERTQPLLHSQGHGRYLFVHSNTFATCLRKQIESRVNGRLEAEDATPALPHSLGLLPMANRKCWPGTA